MTGMPCGQGRLSWLPRQDALLPRGGGCGAIPGAPNVGARQLRLGAVGRGPQEASTTLRAEARAVRPPRRRRGSARAECSSGRGGVVDAVEAPERRNMPRGTVGFGPTSGVVRAGLHGRGRPPKPHRAPQEVSRATARGSLCATSDVCNRQCVALHPHSQGVLHRDVKSSNVLLARDGSGAGVGEIKLADFGISKLLEVTNQAHTVVGTPPYMSPELVRGEPYGTASDAWAFGVMIFELATLRRPFDAGNQLALVRQIVDQQPAPLPVGVAPDIAKAIHGLLEKDPQKRLHIGEVLAMSSALRGMVPLPPPPSFPPPASPFLAVARGYDASGMGSTEEVDVLTLLDDLPGPGRGGLTAGLGSGDAYRESTIDVLMLHAGGSGGVGEFAQPVHDEPAQDWAMGAALSTEELPALPSLGTSRAQAVGLSPRPGYAFSNPEEELQKAAAKEKQWGGGRRWLPRFGMALRGGVSKADRDATVISAFGSEPSDDSDEGGAGAMAMGVMLGVTAPAAMELADLEHRHATSVPEDEVGRLDALVTAALSHAQPFGFFRVRVNVAGVGMSVNVP
eukprot:CAMPEP_0177205920 /NCGR_PEP_ID=MMETSP0367-20130122/29116_1 /TAXON_ID=447022 ORGANISM="Scrippsiella hangoei-like, Strain SHHI-4" /NCGR_SAMPLE_ID=MMETSP0367 /ASSEMBLY_ACC=CAM_ASM_000362 /LENGTH=565 /DNA_ID=CAMNT_0018654671 /DNA_START=19 /DNA_END=1714 /DNA_ORIENTATION=+